MVGILPYKVWPKALILCFCLTALSAVFNRSGNPVDPDKAGLEALLRGRYSFDGSRFDNIILRSADTKLASQTILSVFDGDQVPGERSLMVLPTTRTTTRNTMDRGYVMGSIGSSDAERSIWSVRHCHSLAFTGGFTRPFHSITSRKHTVTAPQITLSQSELFLKSFTCPCLNRARRHTLPYKTSSTSITIPFVKHLSTI